jgi:hypothetical protein
MNDLFRVIIIIILIILILILPSFSHSMLRLDVSSLRSSSSSSSDPVDEKFSHVRDVSFLVKLPDGREFPYSVRSDLTIGYVKLALERDTNISWFRFEFSISGRSLADPLSLADFPEFRTSTKSQPAVILVNILEPEKDENGETEQIADDFRNAKLDEDSDSESDFEQD